MVHYTVLIPVRDATEAVARLLPRLIGVLDRLILPYEIVCIDDASAEPEARALARLLKDHPTLRVLRFDRPRGISAALSAGIAASRGDLLISIGPHAPLGVENIPHMIGRLSRWDLVVARPRRSLVQSLGGGLARVPRMLAARWKPQAAQEPFLAARREALAGLALARGAAGVLPELVARRGLRVGRLTIDAEAQRCDRLRGGFFKRLAAAWLARRFEPHLARELVRGVWERSSTMPAADAPSAPRFARPAGSLPVEPKHAK